MDFPDEFKCNQCLETFSPKNSPFKMPNCKHNLCHRCLDELKITKSDAVQCSFCGSIITQFQRKKIQTNHHLLKKIRTQVGKSPNTTDCPSLEQASHKINSNFTGYEESEMLIGEDEIPAKRNKSIRGGIMVSEMGIQNCPFHKKNLQIICVNDLKRICSHCAIFGQHKNHKFKTFQQFQEDFDERIKDLQLIKQKKYKLDKKFKEWEKHGIFTLKINDKKELLIKEVENYFINIIKKIKAHEQKIKKDLDSSFSIAYNDICEMMKASYQSEGQFSHWQADCENTLNKVCQNVSLNQKIMIMYGGVLQMGKGEKILLNMQKKIQDLSAKVESQINKIKVDFGELNVSLLAKVYQSKKDSKVIFVGDKVPKGKQKGDDDFSDNSFIYDFPSRDISIVLEDSISSKMDSNLIYSETLRPLSPKIENRLIRSKSNMNVKLSDIPTLKKKAKNTPLEPLLAGNPQSVCSEFLKKDLKDVLDLSHCNLNDERAYDCLKQVRRYRRIRGLKLNKNHLTDSGFVKMIDLLGSTSNLNLAENQLTEEILNIIIKNRDKFSPLRIINISSNKTNEKKAKILAEALKKIGIIVTL